MSDVNNSIKQKTKQLSEIIDWFESENIDLEIALDKFKQAETLAAEIEKDLLSLKNEVQIIKKNFDDKK